MTALCGGGASGPKAGVGGVLTLGAVAIEAFISSILVLPELAPLIAPIIAGLVDIEIAAYCATDPPADPGLTATDLEAAIAFPPTGATFTAQQKIVTWFESQYWYQICQCSSVSTPAPSTPSNPGPVATNPGLPTQPTQCWNVTVPFVVPPASTTFSGFVDYTNVGQPAGPNTPITVEFAGGVPQIIASAPMPVGATNLALSGVINESIVQTTATVTITSEPWLANGGPVGTNELFIVQDYSFSGAGSIPSVPGLAPAEVTRSIFVSNNDSIEHTGQFTFSFFCPPGVNVGQPCCPPDPLLEGELQQILQYVQAIYAGLPIPPNSFSEGTVHSGLTGAGSITFSSVPIAIKVTLTTLPAWLGVAPGDPDFYFDVGFLSFATSEGNYSSEKVTFVDQVLSVPILAGSVGYRFDNGVVASITELLPGP